MSPVTAMRAQYQRGKAAKDAQLSKLQRSILVWVLEEEQRLAAGPLQKRRELAKLGVPWSAKAFMRAASLDLSRSTISGSLGSLVERGLLVPAYDGTYANEPRTPGLGPNRRTSHLKFSVLGRAAANYEKKHGKTRRQVLEEAQKEFWRKQLWELRQRRAKAESDYSDALYAYEMAGGVLRDPLTTELSFQKNFEREHKLKMDLLAWDIKEAEARAAGVPVPWEEAEFLSE